MYKKTTKAVVKTTCLYDNAFNINAEPNKGKDVYYSAKDCHKGNMIFE